jgi:hypothetical protein
VRDALVARRGAGSSTPSGRPHANGQAVGRDDAAHTAEKVDAATTETIINHHFFGCRECGDAVQRPGRSQLDVAISPCESWRWPAWLRQLTELQVNF